MNLASLVRCLVELFGRPLDLVQHSSDNVSRDD